VEHAVHAGDHFNIVVPVRAAYEYYTSLGSGLSETIEDDRTLYAAWMFREQTLHDVTAHDQSEKG
jgi:catechol 2,3-dioxygenase